MCISLFIRWLNSSFNNRAQSHVLCWCCVLFVHIACAQPPPSYLGARDFSCAVSVFGQVLIMTRVKRSKTKQKINLCKLFGNSIYSGAKRTSLSPNLFEWRGGCKVMYIVTAWFGFRTNHRLSRSPSLLISGSGIWPQREGRTLALSHSLLPQKT